MVRFLTPSAVISLTRQSSSSTSAAPLVGPAVKLLLQHYQLDCAAIKSTGPKNNLLKNDILSFINERKLSPKPVVAAPPPSSGDHVIGAASPPQLSKSGRPVVSKYVDIPLSNMRSTIAKRLSSSKGTIPHSYQSISIVANNLLALRKQLKRDGYKVSVNDLIIKAVGVALRSVPQLNVQWKNEQVVPLPSVDVSVAVATPNGLITPIIFQADALGVNEISTRIRDLAERARENKLKPNEFQGGSFTISNLGMFDVSHFTAIINPPQTAILAIGGVRMELNEFDIPENIFQLTLCFDARAINDTDAQRFLGHLKFLLSEPETLSMGTEKFENLVNLF